MNRAEYWDEVHRARRPDRVSWYQEDPAVSLRLIRQAGAGPAAPIIDVGGGSSRLVDRLVEAGYRDVTVLDLSPTALSHARQRLGPRAGRVQWVEADLLTHHLEARYAVWHDRAVFHFLTDRTDRLTYIRRMTEAVAPGGCVIIAVFGPDGPGQCSGLPVARYAPTELAAEFTGSLVLIGHEEETHSTPAGASQHFVYAVFRRA